MERHIVGRMHCRFCADVCGVIIAVLGLGSYSFSQKRVLETDLFLLSLKVQLCGNNKINTLQLCRMWWEDLSTLQFMDLCRYFGYVLTILQIIVKSIFLALLSEDHVEYRTCRIDVLLSKCDTRLDHQCTAVWSMTHTNVHYLLNFW